VRKDKKLIYERARNKTTLMTKSVETMVAIKSVKVADRYSWFTPD